jgi:hypothetical protein
MTRFRKIRFYFPFLPLIYPASQPPTGEATVAEEGGGAAEADELPSPEPTTPTATDEEDEEEDGTTPTDEEDEEDEEDAEDEG